MACILLKPFFFWGVFGHEPKVILFSEQVIRRQGAGEPDSVTVFLVFLFRFRHSAIEEDGDGGGRCALGVAALKRHPQHPAASFRDEVATHDTGYFRKDSRTPDDVSTTTTTTHAAPLDTRVTGRCQAVVAVRAAPEKPAGCGNASSCKSRDTPGCAAPSINGHPCGDGEKGCERGGGRCEAGSKVEDLTRAAASLSIAAQKGVPASPAASSGPSQAEGAPKPSKDEPDLIKTEDPFPTTFKIPTPGGSFTEHRPGRSVCEELRQLSRVNSLVERGSLANIRSTSVDENGPVSGGGHGGQGGTASGRGTHIARLIQSKSVNMGERPIYPNVPFSPYGSPCSSPRLRRRPLKESRRVSIEKNGEYIQLNQYKLKEPIGQVRTRTLPLGSCCFRYFCRLLFLLFSLFCFLSASFFFQSFSSSVFPYPSRSLALSHPPAFSVPVCVSVCLFFPLTVCPSHPHPSLSLLFLLSIPPFLSPSLLSFFPPSLHPPFPLSFLSLP